MILLVFKYKKLKTNDIIIYNTMIGENPSCGIANNIPVISAGIVNLIHCLLPNITS